MLEVGLGVSSGGLAASTGKGFVDRFKTEPRKGLGSRATRHGPCLRTTRCVSCQLNCLRLGDRTSRCPDARRSNARCSNDTSALTGLPGALVGGQVYNQRQRQVAHSLRLHARRMTRTSSRIRVAIARLRRGTGCGQRAAHSALCESSPTRRRSPPRWPAFGSASMLGAPRPPGVRPRLRPSRHLSPRESACLGLAGPRAPASA